MSEVKQSHPKGLYILFVTEMWERFSYYGMRAIFVLFLTKALMFDKAFASDIYGSYTGLVYLTPLIGGYMADRYWGNRKSIVIGGIMMAFGQFFMFMAGSFYENIDVARIFMMVGLTALILGNGFFKPNISTMVGQLYPKGDKRIDSAFTIFYMGINLGAFLSPLICGGLGDTGNPADFKWGFLAACIGMTVSTILFVWLKNHYIVTPEGLPVGATPNRNRETAEIDTVAEAKSEFTTGQIFTWVGIEIALFALFFFLGQGVIGSFIFSLSIAAPGFIISDRSLTKIEKQRIWVIFIVAFFVIFFWAAFEQAGASLTFFAEEQTNREVGIHLSKGILSSIFIGIIAILGVVGYKVFTKMKNEQKGVRELILFLVTGAIVYLTYAIIQFPSEGSNIDSIPASFFQSVNAIAIVICAPLFSILWTFLGKKNIEPASPYKQSIGLLLLALGYVVIAFGVKGIEPSTKVSMMWLLSLYLIHTFGELCLSPIGLSMVNKLAPIKFASLLMGVWFLSTASANKFAGTLSSYYPETMVTVTAVETQQTEKGVVLSTKLDKPEVIDGVNYVSIDAISFEGVKDKAVKASIVENIFKDSLTKEKVFLGYKIDSLYAFFMLFVVMAGIASVILFFLSSKLLKMMNGVR
ncbi:MAG: peptide MFS transporter [Bacteroidota bacterium]